MKKIKVIIIALLIIVVCYVTLYRVPFTTRVEYVKQDDVIFLGISPDGGTDKAHLTKGYREVYYKYPDKDYKWNEVVKSSFAKDNGLLDLKEGDKAIKIVKNTYYRPGLLWALLLTTIEKIDVNNPKGKTYVPFSENLMGQEVLIVPENNKYVNNQNN